MNVVYSLLILRKNSKIVVILPDSNILNYFKECQAIGKYPFYNVQAIGLIGCNASVLRMLSHSSVKCIGWRLPHGNDNDCQTRPTPKAFYHKVC